MEDSEAVLIVEAATVKILDEGIIQGFFEVTIKGRLGCGQGVVILGPMDLSRFSLV